MILFVLDASAEHGFGHLVRCINLASLNRRIMQPLFLIKENKAACSLLKKKRLNYIASTKNLLEQIKPELIVFDIAQITQEHRELFELFHKKCVPVVQITDLGLNIIPEAIVIDGSLYPYENFTGELFFGPDFMVLHHKIRHFHLLNRHYRKHINTIFLSLGGGALYRPLRTFIDFFHKHNLKCKISPGFSIKKNQKKILSRIYPSISWLGQTDSVARAIYESDLAVISPGITAYEAAAIGTPALYFSHHSRQEKTAELMMSFNVGHNMGQICAFSPKIMLEKLKSISQKDREMMGINGKNTVDALGLYRVNKIINSVLFSKTKSGVSL